MKPELLAWLACPACGGELAFAMLPTLPREGGDVEEGTLVCRACRVEYPVVESVPRLLPPRRLEPRVRRTRRSFGWEWLRYPVEPQPEDREILLEETQVPAEDWAGRLVLDAGCGMGRYAKAARGLGARVVAFDLSESLLRLVPLARKDRDLHVVQGDLLAPPFKPEAFDAAYSQGVLHHTADTRGAFDRVARLVKRDGLLAVWVYGSPGSWRSFSTNPLKPGRRWLKAVLPLVWLVVWARRILSDALRVVTTRLPVPLLYLLCYPLAALGAVPLVKYLTFSVHPRFRVRLIENFDWLAPPFQTKHTKEEVAGWFQAAGFDVLRNLPHGVVPKVGILGRRR